MLAARRVVWWLFANCHSKTLTKHVSLIGSNGVFKLAKATPFAY
jgi:hypothetical protein